MPDSINFPALYAELRRLAAAQMAGEPGGHTLDPTGLVHEAFFKLGDLTFPSESEFFRAAAVTMRRVLVDHARAKRADKRGGRRRRTALEPDCLVTTVNADIVAIDDALIRLAAVKPQAAELVTLRYFAGLTIPEAAEALGVSARTADRLWVFARAWLLNDLTENGLA